MAGHPPGATLTFVGLDRIGLSGGGWAGTFCIVTGSSVAAAALIALRALSGEHTARIAAPFLALSPAAVWVGASADGYFAAVAAWGLALLALSTNRTMRMPSATAVGSGVLFGLMLYLSYGLTLMALPALAILWGAKNAKPLPWALLGVAVVACTFTALGFRWWDAYPLLVERYHQGSGGVRPYGYWVWGNLAAVVAAAGLAAVAGARRAVVVAVSILRKRPALALPGTRSPSDEEAREPQPDRAVALLVCGILLALAAADVSGMSKAETERIWLPFTLWLPAAALLLPSRGRRGWLACQAVAALLVNHLLLTYW